MKLINYLITHSGYIIKFFIIIVKNTLTVRKKSNFQGADQLRYIVHKSTSTIECV